MNPLREAYSQALARLDVAGKEIEETLAFFNVAAPYLEQAFGGLWPEHVVDVGGGRGLTALCWLCLAKTPRATIVDQHMPQSHAATSRELGREFSFEQPGFFVGKLAEFPPPEGVRTALVGIHCCGALTDDLIEAAIQARAPFAVMSCCHAFRDPLLKPAATWLAPGCDPSSLVDLMRLDRARQRGYSVKLDTINPSITPKNRVLMGKPRSRTPKPAKPHEHASAPWEALRTLRARRHYLGRILHAVAAGEATDFEVLSKRSFINVRVVGHEGRNYLVRVKPNSPKRLAALGRLEREQRFYELAADAGLPVPHVLAVDGRGKLIRNVFMVRTFLPGQSADTILPGLAEAEQRALSLQAGDLLRRIHSCPAEPDRPLAADDSDLRTNPGRLAEEIDQGVTRMRAQSVCPRWLDRARAFAREHEAAMGGEGSAHVLLHGDYHFGNLLVDKRDSGWAVTGIIDAEEAALGDALWDLATMEYEDAFRGPHMRDAFLEGFGRRPDMAAYWARALALILARPEKDIERIRRMASDEEPFARLRG